MKAFSQWLFCTIKKYLRIICVLTNFHFFLFMTIPLILIFFLTFVLKLQHIKEIYIVTMGHLVYNYVLEERIQTWNHSVKYFFLLLSAKCVSIFKLILQNWNNLMFLRSISKKLCRMLFQNLQKEIDQVYFVVLFQIKRHILILYFHL